MHQWFHWPSPSSWDLPTACSSYSSACGLHQWPHSAMEYSAAQDNQSKSSQMWWWWHETYRTPLLLDPTRKKNYELFSINYFEVAWIAKTKHVCIPWDLFLLGLWKCENTFCSQDILEVLDSSSESFKNHSFIN